MVVEYDYESALSQWGILTLYCAFAAAAVLAALRLSSQWCATARRRALAPEVLVTADGVVH